MKYYTLVIMKSDLENIYVIKDTDEPEKKNNSKSITSLKKCYLEDNYVLEIGVDEAGRGPLFGRVYAAAVILPKDDVFDHSKMKDSKKFHSKKKIEEVANYIKENAIAWYVSYEDEKTIDEINILQATQKAMHDCIKNVIEQKKNSEKDSSSFQLLIDGNYFNPVKMFNNNKYEFIPHICIEGGDNKYSAIAAASILAKVSRDTFVKEWSSLEENKGISERYGLLNNKGYGTAKHREGLKTHGPHEMHRKQFIRNWI